jgi:hypothetical protein
MKQLANIEPIPLPDPRRAGMMPSLPAWLARCSGAVRLELQPTRDGRTFADVLTLPAEMMPGPEHRRAIEEHIDSLNSYLQQTPAGSDKAETEIASAVTSLLLGSAGARKSELGAEVSAHVYLEMLDDVPWWAVKAACRKWFDHDCGTDERGQPYDYTWAPGPGTLRRIARGETWQVRKRILDLQKVLDARAYVDCAKQLADGRAAMRGLSIHMKNGSSKPLSFADAIAIAKRAEEGGGGERSIPWRYG